MKINWDNWCKVQEFMDSRSLMCGEEKTLSDEEIEQFNGYLETMNVSITSLNELVGKAQSRFAKKIK